MLASRLVKNLHRAPIVVALVSILVVAAMHPRVAGAEMGASASTPIVRDIDDRCDAREKAAEKRPGVLVTRLYTPAGKPGPWLHATIASNRKLGDGGAEYHADFASISEASGGAIAGLDATDSTGDGGSGTTWCFLDGKLARARLVIGSATDDVVWKRTDYYGDSSELLTHRSETKDLSKPTRTKPTWPPGAETIPAYRTVEKLPFYAAYLAARSGRLQMMKGARTP